MRLAKDLAVENLVPELRVEALAVDIFPGRAGLDVGGPEAEGGDPPAPPWLEARNVIELGAAITTRRPPHRCLSSPARSRAAAGLVI